MQLGRRRFLGAAGGAALSASLTTPLSMFAAGCSATGGGAGPVTIRHLFGETVIPAKPGRVICAGYTGQDDLLAMGVVPVAVTEWFGEQPFATWPWARPLLGDAQPVVLRLDDGIELKPIAELEPDLIVATNAGVDADTYENLSAIAPTVPQSGPEAFFEPWRIQADSIGRAVFESERMRAVIESVDRRLAAVAETHPSFKGRTALLLHGRREHGALQPLAGWRTEFLTRMGLTVPDTPPIDPDRVRSALSEADVLIWLVESDQERDALLADSDVAEVFAHRSIFTTLEQAAATLVGSVLSYPLLAEQLPGPIAKILG